MKVEYFDREAWGARTDLPRRGLFVAADERTGLVQHHSVGGRLLSTSYEQAVVYVKGLQTSVAARLGADIPYSFVVCLIRSAGVFSLLVCEGRGWFRSGAHTVDTIDDDDPEEKENQTLLAPGWQGDWRTYVDVLEEYGDPEAILDDAVRSLGLWLRQQAGINIPEHQIDAGYGHRDFKITSCPSDGLYARTDILLNAFLQGDDDMTLSTRLAVNALWLETRGTHVEESGDGPDLDTDPDESGQVRLTRIAGEVERGDRTMDGLRISLEAINTRDGRSPADVAALKNIHAGYIPAWVLSEGMEPSNIADGSTVATLIEAHGSNPDAHHA